MAASQILTVVTRFAFARAGQVQSDLGRSGDLVAHIQDLVQDVVSVPAPADLPDLPDDGRSGRFGQIHAAGVNVECV